MNKLHKTSVLIFLFCAGCIYRTSGFIETNLIRESRAFLRKDTYIYEAINYPSPLSPKLELKFYKHSTRQLTQERLFVARSSLTGSQQFKLDFANILGLKPKQELISQIPEEDKEWRRENIILPSEKSIAQNIKVIFTLPDTTFVINTNQKGTAIIDLAPFKEDVRRHGTLRLAFHAEDKPSSRMVYIIQLAQIALKSGRSPVAIAREESAPTPVLDTTAKPEGVDTAPETRVVEAVEEDKSEPVVPLTPEPHPDVADRRERRGVRFVESPRPAAETLEPPADRPVLAILDFEGYGFSTMEAKVLTNRLSTHFIQLGIYRVIERGQMEQILQEQNFQISGCTSNECAVEIGRIIGCEQMLAGTFGKIGSLLTLDMRIINVETGDILRTAAFDMTGTIEELFTKGLEDAARQIAGLK